MRDTTTATRDDAGLRISGRLALLCVVLSIAACTGPAAATPSSAASNLPSSQSPAASSSAQASASTGTLFVDDEHGLVLTLPPEWLGISASDAKDIAKMDELRAEVGAGPVDSLVSALEKNPQYWLAALRGSDENVLTVQLRGAPDFDAWSIEQEEALKDAYGTVDKTPVSAPREGMSFSWTSNGFVSRLYGFERPGGVAIFTFVGPAGAPKDWDSAISSFTDTGK